MQPVLNIYKKKIIGLNDFENNKLYYNDCSLNIFDNHAEINVSIKSCNDAERVSISVYLQKNLNGWSTHKYWIQDYSSTYGLLSLNSDIEDGYDYRIIVNFYVIHGSYTEWFTVVLEE